MIGIVRTLPRSRGQLRLKNDRGDFMSLPLFFYGLTKPASIWPAAAVRPSLVAAAAIAGYVIFMPFAQKTATDAMTEQPQWVGNIERPDVQTQVQLEPTTSASYVLPDAVSTGTVAKKAAVSVAAAPKAVNSKLVTPPRKPQSIEDAGKPTQPTSATVIPVAMTASDGIPRDVIPPEPIPPHAETPPRPRNLFSPVTDRLPARGTLMTPFHVVGDAVHNLIKFF